MAKESKPAQVKQTTAPATAADKQSHKKKHYRPIRLAVRKIMKSVSPVNPITNKATKSRTRVVNIQEDVALAAIRKVAERAGSIVDRNHRKQIGVNDVITAVRFEFGPALAEQAVAAINEAVDAVANARKEEGGK